MCLEREDISNLSEWWYEIPYARYTEAMIQAPGDLVEEWEMLWGLARRMGTGMPLAGGACPMDERPSKQVFLDLMVAGCTVPPSRVRADTVDGRAVIYTDLHPVVEPGDPDAPGRFDLGAGGLPDQLVVYAAADLPTPDFPYRLVSRRSRHRFNSTGQNLSALTAKRTTNPAFLHPDDMARIPCNDGDIVRIRSAAGDVVAVARAATNMRPGVVSMAHAFGGPDVGADEVRERGASTNRLVSETIRYDPITGQSLQSAIPVAILPA
jgi:anaerobic selenocysteine-containing dehydrogenase